MRSLLLLVRSGGHDLQCCSILVVCIKIKFPTAIVCRVAIYGPQRVPNLHVICTERDGAVQGGADAHGAFHGYDPLPSICHGEDLLTSCWCLGDCCGDLPGLDTCSTSGSRGD